LHSEFALEIQRAGGQVQGLFVKMRQKTAGGGARG